MASMNSKDGFNARDLAIHAGHLELAKLFKGNNIPRTSEQSYCIPAPPRPVCEAIFDKK